MQSFKITREELLKFAQRLYKEGVCGYLDLCEATAESMLTDFLDGREIITPGILNESITVNSNAFAFVGGVGPGMGMGVPQAGPPPQSTPMMVGVDPAGPPPGNMAESVYGSDLYNARPETATQQSDPIWTGGPNIRTDPMMTENVLTVDRIAETPPSPDGIVITETPVIREQVFVRTENYHGNPSERL